MTSEREVRTRAGWIGVEISKSRARTPRNPEYGLYRVRGTELPTYRTRIDQDPMDPVLTKWTAYAFTLDAIEQAVRMAIEGGTPQGPAELSVTRYDTEIPFRVGVPTRWTSAYRGRRDLGIARGPGCEHLFSEACPDGPSMGEHAHGAEHCCRGGRPHLGPCVAPVLLGDGLQDATTTDACEALLVRVVDAMTAGEKDRWYDDASYATRSDLPTARQRQRAYNAAFQREHLKRRAWGLQQRYARKLEHNEAARSQEQAERPSQRGQGGPNGCGLVGQEG